MLGLESIFYVVPTISQFIEFHKADSIIDWCIDSGNFLMEIMGNFLVKEKEVYSVKYLSRTTKLLKLYRNGVLTGISDFLSRIF